MSKTELQNTKIELAKFILNSHDESLISRIKEVIEGETEDFWFDLDDYQKKEIEISRSQIKNGQTEDWETLKLRLS